MTNYSIPAFNILINNMRTHFAKNLPEKIQWEGVRELVKTLCANETMRNASRSWIAKKGREYVLHIDEEYDFFVGALVREPHHRAGIHDHGPSWTIYGVLDGVEMPHIYKSIDDPNDPHKTKLEIKNKYNAPTGHGDIVPPHVIHCEWGMSERSVAITVRTANPNTYDQNRFDLKTGKTWTSRGLNLVPLIV